MNLIDRIQEQYDSSNKEHKSKTISSTKERATKQYFKDEAARARRKQGKTNYDTFRREEQPDEEDLRLEDMHFANFLGFKEDKYGVPYNNLHINDRVNICECDIYLQSFSGQLYPRAATAPQDVEEDDYECINIQDYNNIRQIERKRAHMEFTNEEQPEAKRARSEDIFESMVAYMREQVKLAQQMVDNGELYWCDCDCKWI